MVSLPQNRLQLPTTVVPTTVGISLSPRLAAVDKHLLRVLRSTVLNRSSPLRNGVNIINHRWT